MGVPLAASGFGSGYPLILAAYRQMVVLCLLASPASFLIFHFSFYSASRIRSYPSRIPMPPPRTDNSRPAVRSKLSHQHQGNHTGLPLHFCASHKLPTAYPQYKPFNNTQTVGANLVFALILQSHFVLCTNRSAYAPRRAPACAKVSEEKRRTV